LLIQYGQDTNGTTIDFKEALEVASDIVSSVQSEDTPSFRHHSSNIRVPFRDLADRMRSIYGGEFNRVDMSEWLQSAVKLGIEDLIVSYIEANIVGGGDLTFPYLGE